MADRKNNKGLLPLGSLVEDIIFEKLVILGKPCLLYWVPYWGGLQTHVCSSIREHAEMSRAIGVALWQTPGKRERPYLSEEDIWFCLSHKTKDTMV